MLRELLEYKLFLKEVVAKEFRSRYRSSILGLAWTVLVPLAHLLALGMVLFFITRGDPKVWGARFLGGYTAWMIFAGAVNAAVGSVVANASFVTKSYAPRSAFPVVAFIVGLIEGIIMAPVAILVLLVFGGELRPTMILLPLALLVFAPFILGVCFLFAALNVRWRDVAFLWGTLSTVLFFLTPIIYPIESVPQAVRPLLTVNPIYSYVAVFQQLFVGRMPAAELWIAAILLSGITLAIGASVFRRSEQTFYQYL